MTLFDPNAEQAPAKDYVMTARDIERAAALLEKRKHLKADIENLSKPVYSNNREDDGTVKITWRGGEVYSVLLKKDIVDVLTTMLSVIETQLTQMGVKY